MGRWSAAARCLSAERQRHDDRRQGDLHGRNTGHRRLPQRRRNIGDGYPTTNREALIKLSPDVLLIAAPGEPAGQGMQDPRITPWIDLPIPAARQDRIYLVTDPSGQLLTLSIADQLRSPWPARSTRPILRLPHPPPARRRRDHRFHQNNISVLLGDRHRRHRRRHAAVLHGRLGRRPWRFPRLAQPGYFCLRAFARVLAAAIVGAALAGAGVVLQSMLRNPLADPLILGIAGGANLAAAIWMLYSGFFLVVAPFLGEAAFATVGAILSILVVFFLARRRGTTALEPVTVLLVGIVVNVHLPAPPLFYSSRWPRRR